MMDAASSSPRLRSKRIRIESVTTAPLSPKSSPHPVAKRRAAHPKSIQTPSRIEYVSDDHTSISDETREILKSIFDTPFPDPQYTEADIKSDSEIVTTIQTLALPANQVPTLPLPSVPQFILNLPGGIVSGKLTYGDNGYIIDCNRRVTSIPRDIELISNMKSNALFILLVGNYSTFMELVDVSFYDRFPCIIVSAGGPPDFLYKLKTDLNLPVLALFDCDPKWLKMLPFYGLVFNDIKWLGIRPTDFDKYKMDELTFPMTKKDIKIVGDLLESDFFKKNPNWIKELKLMLDCKRKADIEDFFRFGFRYLTSVFLPMKLQDQDWI